MNPIKKLSRTAVGAALGATFLLAIPTGATADAGTGYDGTDPATTGCSSSGWMIFERDLYDPSGAYAGTVQVWYSDICQTNWVRSYMPYSDGIAHKRIERPAQGSLPAFFETESDGGAGWSYSMQVYAPGSTAVTVSAVHDTQVYAPQLTPTTLQ